MESTPETVEMLLKRIARLEARVAELERNPIREATPMTVTHSPEYPKTYPDVRCVGASIIARSVEMQGLNDPLKHLQDKGYTTP